MSVDGALERIWGQFQRRVLIFSKSFSLGSDSQAAVKKTGRIRLEMSAAENRTPPRRERKKTHTSAFIEEPRS